ncbi:DUF6285 domain-containing protein [Noviherbaspirillum sedimenti]|uniref:DUF6285 domain-containing protein n=1 Tax=Noviherbaspirillum sedimenti TaxID=2320865 RepID=A0A3A3FX83_9BURK|nr:DUF6285 domain-containing protein [Noviherbaspirillum sedimenti]RJG00828.1 hypothetical protein D3878_03880 [Noviherbaspirillum sedimenti]
MSDRPNGQDLLLTAREELMKRLLPALPAELRYSALMVANAMAIAARELDAGQSGDLRELAGLQQLLPGEATAEAPVDGELLQHALTGYRKELCAQIRVGNFDAGKPSHQELLRHLAENVSHKLTLSNPRLLSSRSAK